MNNRNAWGFLSFGFIMGLLPLLKSEWFPPTGVDGTSTRVIWLELMGIIQLLLGGTGVIWLGAIPAAIHWLAFTPPPPSPVAPVIAFEIETELPDAEPVASLDFEESMRGAEAA